MKKSRDIFLETSIQIKNILGHPLIKREIKKTIENKSCYSSLFVLGEFKRSIISALIDFYFLIDSEDSIDEALAALSEEYHDRKIKFIIAAFGQIIKEEDLNKNKAKCLIRLQSYIKSALYAFDLNLDEGRNYIDNKIKCDHSKVPININDNYTLKENYEAFRKQMSCRKKDAGCNCINFWKENKSNLNQLLKDENQEKYKNVKSYKELIVMYQKVKKDYTEAEGNNCKKLADTIIAIECPKNQTLLTLDQSFDALCPIFSKDYIRLPSLKKLKEQQKLQKHD